MTAETGLEAIDYEYPVEIEKMIDVKLKSLQDSFNKKVVVVDDDPTGGQTVHGVDVYTSWSVETLVEAFDDKRKMFYIMTNSRSMQSKTTVRVHRELTANLIEAARLTGKEFVAVSRGDSTLRGHYPLETETIRSEFSLLTGEKIDGEIVIPFFEEGGRYTIDDVHYLQSDSGLIPVGCSEFARDKSFGYANSDLKLWIEEKSNGEYKAEKVKSISLSMLRNREYKEITSILESLEGFEKLVVNATCYSDLKVFCVSFLEAVAKGKRFISRSAAAWPKILGGVITTDLLGREQIVNGNLQNGGLIVIGSHVNKTTEQLEELRKEGDNLRFIEFNQHLAVEAKGLEEEIASVASEAERSIKAGITAVIHTKRKRIDLGVQNAEEELIITNKIADAITGIIGLIDAVPRYIVIKGGITSSDIAVKALNVGKAEILGQVYPGIPVWRLGSKSKYPGLSYVIFPGNVGKRETLREIAALLDGRGVSGQ